MSEEMLIRYASPTLAGIKTGNLFSCPCADRETLRNEVCRVNRSLRGKGLCLIPLRFFRGKVLLYLFRPEKLAKDLTGIGAAEILKKAGYRFGRTGEMICQLRERFEQLSGGKTAFPHEIGLFLSYPAEDVQGFIENGACHFKCSGCWKVYGDVDSARRCFERYRRCTRDYTRRYRRGDPVEKLAVRC